MDETKETLAKKEESTTSSTPYSRTITPRDSEVTSQGELSETSAIFSPDSRRDDEQSIATLGVDVHSWTPDIKDNVKFTVWDVQGASDSSNPYSANFGAHPGTQSLLFSD
jgi:hypothetical protein